ncbi:MAG TPA: type VI secretion system-associated FHA domain protein [candidate division Zixibacteria bacterium]|jgi:predicted component of type VI protein secretion system
MDQSEIQRLQEENAKLRRQLELSRTAYDYLVRLAHHFSGDEVAFESPDQIRAFCERIKRAVESLVDGIKTLMAGRKQMQRQWSLYASQPQQGTAFVRVAELRGDLGRSLLDWQNPALDDQNTRQLQNSVNELKHHQLALMAGYERCVREGALAVLRELDPDIIEGRDAPAAGGPESHGSLKQLLPWRTAGLFRTFRRRYADLIAEDAQWYQSRFLPLFRQGYKEYMWAAVESELSGEGRRT